MSLPILQPNSMPNLPQIRGEVIIDPSVIIASGVILNATPGNKIIIHGGVCLGMGSIITAHEGDVEVQANAILGPGTLILGNCVIGSQASLGTSVTVYHANIKKLAVIPAGSIIGDYSRKLDSISDEAVVIDQDQKHKVVSELGNQEAEKTELSSDNDNKFAGDSIIDKINELNKNKHSATKESVSFSQSKVNHSTPIGNSPQSVVNQVNNVGESKSKQENISGSSSPVSFEKSAERTNSEVLEQTKVKNSDNTSQGIIHNKEVVGKVYINRLLYTLFPDRNTGK